MGVGAGIFLVAIGAILKYAVADEIDGVDLGAIGVILMIAGAAVALFALFFHISRRERTGGVIEERYDRSIGDPM